MPRQLLVLQVRDHGPARDQEQACFCSTAGELADVDFFDLLATERITWSDVESSDVLVIGGAGAHTVTETYGFSDSLGEVTRRWVAEGRPFFGSCWGHHFLAWALGGSVITDDAAEEVGTFEIELTEAGRADPLLAGFPPRFPGQLGHHDRIDRLPPGVIELARSERCRHQMLRLEGLQVYSTQFHPEMSARDLRERLAMYADSYISEDFAALMEKISPSPEASTLLERFLKTLD